MVTTEAYLAAVCESALTMERPPYVLRSQGLDLPSEWRAMGRILGPNPGDDLAVLEMARPRLAARLKSWELRPGKSVVSYAMVPSSQLLVHHPPKPYRLTPNRRDADHTERRELDRLVPNSRGPAFDETGSDI